jgi:hypothetical protein
MSALLDLPDEALVLLVLKCCDVTHVMTKSATGSTSTLLGPSCLIMCTNKRLRDCGKKDPVFAERMTEKRTALLHAFFWTRIRFLSRAWGTVQRAAVLGLSAVAEQKHVLQKGGQSLTITAHFHRRKRNKCHIALELLMRDAASTGLCGVLANMHVDLPPAYATRPEKRTLKQKDEMQRWKRDRSSALDSQFAELNKRFVQVGRPIFAYW